MARISGIELPDKKRIDIALTKLYGVGRSRARQILVRAKIDPATRATSLKDNEIAILQKIVDQYTTEGTLRKIVTDNIKRLVSIGSYRGIRHDRGLPTRGQRTRSNARTRRGKRRTIGAIKKDTLARTGTAEKKKETT